MTRLYVDVETRWKLDLRRYGAYRCVSDASAGINCIGWAVDDQPPFIETYEMCQRGALSSRFIEALKQATVIVAHNALFDYLVLTKLLRVETELTRWSDTMARAAYYGYPRSLDDAAKALGATLLKDIQGAAVMRRLVKGEATPTTDAAAFARLYAYCANDVAVTQQIDKLLPELPSSVAELWRLDAIVNLRGVPIDKELAECASRLWRECKPASDSAIREITGGAVSTINQRAKLLAWLASQGVNLPDCSAATIERALHQPLPSSVREALRLRQLAGVTSPAKWQSILDCEVGGRLYWMFDFYASHTGRSAGKKPQLQNLPRAENAELAAEIVSAPPDLVLTVAGQPERYLKEALRCVIKAPPGKTLIGADLKQIEARATAWLANETTLLQAFASGRDVYLDYAVTMFGRPAETIKPIERTAAKAAVLALGFGGGIGAYQRVADLYGLDLSILANSILPTASYDELARATESYARYYDANQHNPNLLGEAAGRAVDIVKQRYRKHFSRIVDYWRLLENAFIMGGTANRVRVIAGDQNERILVLPSGRALYYRDVRISESGDMSYQGRHVREQIWYGLLMENVAQAVNFDCSTWYMLRSNEIAPIVHHCHDEFTLEVECERAAEVREKLRQLFATAPEWAEGLPIDFDMWEGERYG